MRKTFSLIEALVSISIIGIIIIIFSATFLALQNSWVTQKNILKYTEEASWMLNLLSQELRMSSSSPQINPVRLRFRLDTDGDLLWDTTVEYWWGRNNQLRRRQQRKGGGWSPWEILLDEVSSVSIQNTGAKFYLIQISITKGKKTLSFRTGVSLKN